ncbi:hypothetical protein C8R45DRAFT_928594 [Mycena sanguinolenta]|nr:hypothetical protein C8R45DRAFT_928594 [Mycena sanguinolenta]
MQPAANPEGQYEVGEFHGKRQLEGLFAYMAWQKGGNHKQEEKDVIMGREASSMKQAAEAITYAAWQKGDKRPFLGSPGVHLIQGLFVRFNKSHEDGEDHELNSPRVGLGIPEMSEIIRKIHIILNTARKQNQCLKRAQSSSDTSHHPLQIIHGVKSGKNGSVPIFPRRNLTQLMRSPSLSGLNGSMCANNTVMGSQHRATTHGTGSAIMPRVITTFVSERGALAFHTIRQRRAVWLVTMSMYLGAKAKIYDKIHAFIGTPGALLGGTGFRSKRPGRRIESP